VSKKLEEKQRRRLAEERKKEAQKKAHRRRNLITTVIALVVAGGVVALVINDRNRAQRALENFGVTSAQANCDPVEEQEEQSRDHIEVGAAHEPYTTNPPSSGPHYNAAGLGPVQTGFYENAAEAPPEGVVHNLEHGQIVIYYNPDAPDEVIDDIELAVKSEPIATVATPYSGLPADANLVLTAWTVSQSCEQVSMEVVNEFRSAYQGVTGPEKLTPTFED
jgi:hypothetical protein